MNRRDAETQSSRGRGIKRVAHNFSEISAPLRLCGDLNGDRKELSL
jgi:hypothetical protein